MKFLDAVQPLLAAAAAIEEAATAAAAVATEATEATTAAAAAAAATGLLCVLPLAALELSMLLFRRAMGLALREGGE